MNFLIVSENHTHICKHYTDITTTKQVCKSGVSFSFLLFMWQLFQYDEWKMHQYNPVKSIPWRRSWSIINNRFLRGYEWATFFLHTCTLIRPSLTLLCVPPFSHQRLWQVPLAFEPRTQILKTGTQTEYSTPGKYGKKNKWKMHLIC